MGCQYKTMDMDNAPLNGTGTGDARANSEHCRIHCGQILASISSGILHLAIRSLFIRHARHAHRHPPPAAPAVAAANPQPLERPGAGHDAGGASAHAAAGYRQAARAGLPVHASSGIAGGYALRPGKALPPLLLDDEEALAVAITLRTAAAGSVGGIEETALRALIKLEQVMPARLRRCAPPSCRWSRMAPRWTRRCWPRWRRPAAINCGWRLIIGMGAAGQLAHGGTARRGARQPALVLVAWDPARDDWRIFRLDRIAGDHGRALRAASLAGGETCASTYRARCDSAPIRRTRASCCMRHGGPHPVRRRRDR